MAGRVYTVRDHITFPRISGYFKSFEKLQSSEESFRASKLSSNCVFLLEEAILIRRYCSHQHRQPTLRNRQHSIERQLEIVQRCSAKDACASRESTRSRNSKPYPFAAVLHSLLGRNVFFSQAPKLSSPVLSHYLDKQNLTPDHIVAQWYKFLAILSGHELSTSRIRH